VAPVKEELRRSPEAREGLDQIHAVRSIIPAVTHVDFSARLQTVAREQNPLFYKLLECFEARTGSAALVNTSFNVRGEPVVCTPDDAYRGLVNTEMDALAIGPFFLERARQPHRRLEHTFETVPD